MIDIQEIEYCKILVKYEADNDAIANKKNEIVNKFKGQKVPGFRNNHVPVEAIKQHFRKEINDALKQELANDAVNDVVSEKNIKPFGGANFTHVSLEEPYLISLNGAAALPKFKCEFSLYVQPEFELKAYKDFEIPPPGGIASPEEFAQLILQELRTKNGSIVPYEADDFVQMGDTVILDYKTTLDGEPVASLTDSGQILNVGRINIPGFSESLLGMKPGESREFDLNMPDTYNQEFAGKTLHFDVKVNMGSKVEPAPLNDELAVKIGIDNFDNLMLNVRQAAAARVAELEMLYKIDQISRRLIDNHDFKIPDWISISEGKINANNAGKKWDDISDSDKEKYIDAAANSVKLSLILQKVRENEPDAQISDEETFEFAKKNIAQHSQEPDKVIAEIYKNGHLPLLFGRIRDQFTLDFIQKTSKTIEKEV